MPLEKMEAPLPGKILNIKANVGDKVSEGDEILSIEAMKMENPLMAPVNGVVKEINVTKGQTVKAGDNLAVIEY
jgi:glutaconyl-CoA/methylmalonyl-CoA decarboxylase subunit gamma